MSSHLKWCIAIRSRIHTHGREKEGEGGERGRRREEVKRRGERGRSRGRREKRGKKEGKEGGRKEVPNDTLPCVYESLL